MTIDKMRVLMIGSNEIWAIEKYYLKYFRELNVEIDLFPAQSIFYKYYNRGIFQKLLFRAGLSNIFQEIDKAVKQKILSYQPDIIWIFKGMEISPAMLMWVQEKGIKLVNYNPDNPFIFTGRGSGNKNITNSLELYDLYFTYSLEVEKQLKQRFKKRVALLPFAFEIPEAIYEIAKSQPEILRPCFLGNPDPVRAAFIKHLADKGTRIDIYGNNWQRYINHPGVEIHPAVYGQEFWNILARYRIQLNIMRIHNENSHNMRSFEVPAIGGIMLAPDTVEHRIFFEAGKEIFLYTDSDDCIEKINFLLALPIQHALAIRTDARRKSIEKGYSYRDRAREVAEEMKLLYV